MGSALKIKRPLTHNIYKKDFPLLHDTHPQLHYLDNAATTHKPQSVIDAIVDAYSQTYGPIHRGLYPLAEAATAAYEEARETLAHFIGAASSKELIFTRSATEAINLVAQGWARPRLREGDCIWVTRMEHHSNFLPWQRICSQKGADLKIVELKEDGMLDWESAEGLFDRPTRLIVLTQVSNVLGVENPVRAICAKAQQAGIPVLVDGAQAVGHQPVNVRELDCDFFTFSGHKMYGPTGIGALYGKIERLEEMEPLLLGGGIVDQVDDRHFTLGSIPERFEAGSPNLAGAIGFAAAANYLLEIGLAQVHTQVSQLSRAALDALSQCPDIRLLPGRNTQRHTIISFIVDGIHPHDLAQIAGEAGVAIRAGHHCCQPLMNTLGLNGTARLSLGLYNDAADVDALLLALDQARRLIG